MLKQGEGDAPESTVFVGYTTEHASDYAITCLQQDPHYALDCTARGTLAGNPIIKGELQFEGALNYEGCRLSPGTEKNPYGQITVAHDLTINQAIYVEENIKSEGEKQQDRFVVLGNLNKKLSPILHSQAGWGIFLLYSHPHLTGKRQGSICYDEQGAYRPFCESKITKNGRLLFLIPRQLT